MQSADKFRVLAVAGLLGLLPASATLFAQADKYFPPEWERGFTWVYESTVDGLPSVTETQKYVDTATVDGRMAREVQEIGPGGIPLSSAHYSFEGDDVFVNWASLPPPLDSLLGSRALGWIRLFRLVGTSDPAWTVFDFDTTIDLNGLLVPVRVQVTGKVTSTDEAVSIPAGRFECTHIDLTSKVGTELGPIFIPFVTLVDSFWIAETTWVVRQSRETVEFTFDTVSLTLPGIRKILQVYGIPVAVDETDPLPAAPVQLYSNYPNPFNPTTTIRYFLSRPSQVVLRVFDIAGRVVSDLSLGWQDGGHHAFVWDASELPSGTYFYELLADNESRRAKAIVVR